MLALSPLSYAASALALLSAVAGQTPNRVNGTLATQLQLQAAEAHLRQAQIAGQPTYLIPRFSPQGVLNLTYGGQQISSGQKVPQSEANSAPTISVAPVGESGVSLLQNYAVMMVDADIVGTNEATTPQTRHWLVNGVRLQSGPGGTSPYSLDFSNSTAVTDYAGPGPASGSGSHRYVVLLYTQSSSFTPQANLSTAGVGMGTWILDQYVRATGLGPLVAANYFQVENGQATVTVPETTAVQTSTLAIAQAISTSLEPLSSAPSGSRTSGNVAPSASSSRAAAGQTKEMGMGAVVCAVSVLGCVLGAAALGL